MKKPFVWLSLLLVLALTLSACGTAATTEPPAVETQPPAVEPSEPPAATEPPVEETTEAPVETEAPTEPATEEPGAGEIDCFGAEGTSVSLLYQWSGLEEENLTNILQPLLDACDITLEVESTRDQAILDTRVQANNPPDIAFWNIAQLEQYADLLVAIDDLPVAQENYADFWRELGSIDGTWYGLPVKADVKSIIWYSPVAFEAFGYTVPETWDDLEALVEQMVADGNTPWSMGFESGDATGWTGTDFIQDILLVTQGPNFVQGLIDGTVAYNDPAVAEAYELYGRWARDEAYTVGGAQGTLSTGFNDAILAVFADPPLAMMVKQSGFAGGTIAETYPALVYGVDYDFFQVPGVQGLQGGTDWMMAFSDSPAVQAVFAYLSSETGARRWAEVGFDITPNLAGAEGYTNESLAKRADMLYNAATLVADVGDAIPGGFGSAEFRAVTDFVNGADLQPLLDNLAEIQAQNTGQ